MTEEDIIKMIRLGGKDREIAVRALYDGLAQHFLRFFVYQGASQDQAWDVLQETIVKIIRYAETFDGEGSPKSWMWQIARNCFIDSHRKVPRVSSNDAVKMAKSQATSAARSTASLGAVITEEEGVKVTKLPYVGDTSKAAERIASSELLFESGVTECLDAVTDPNGALIEHNGSVDGCVTAGLDDFSKKEPERALVLLLQMDGYSIEEIGLRIGRTIAATKQYLCESKKKIAPYIAHCTELLLA